MDNLLSFNIGFIGGGNMAKAICEGMIKSGVAKYSQIYVAGPHIENLNEWKLKGANVSIRNGDVVKASDIIFLSIKPHILSTAIDDVCKTLPTCEEASNKLFVSILAGTKLDVLQTVLSKFENSRVIRVMPNTPLMVGEGCICYCKGETATDTDIENIKKIFRSSVICEELPEKLINAFGALAGSGPAYGYLIIEALADGGVKMGLPRAFAMKSAAQTLLGAAKMVLETGKHPGTLKDEVCSPGGTTIVGIHALEKARVRSAMIDAVEAAANRSLALEQQPK